MYFPDSKMLMNDRMTDGGLFTPCAKKIVQVYFSMRVTNCFGLTSENHFVSSFVLYCMQLKY